MTAPTALPRSPALAVVALVAGILAVALIVTGPFAIVPGLAAVVTGVIALVRRAPGREMALGGLVTGAVGVLGGIVATLVAVLLPGAFVVLAGVGAFPLPHFGTPPRAHPYGEVVVLREYSVSVDEVTTVDGVVFADLTVRFDGTPAGDASGDSVGNVAEDLGGHVYSVEGNRSLGGSWQCTATTDPDPADLAPLAAGEFASFQLCFEVAESAEEVIVQITDGQGFGSFARWSATPDPTPDR